MSEQNSQSVLVDDGHHVLARQLTDGLSAAVLGAPIPPLPDLPAPFTARDVDPAGPDADLITEWMNRPHLAQAWEYANPVSWWRGHLEAQTAGTYSRPLIVFIDGTPGGYVELYRAAQDSIATRYDAQPHDVGLHAAIADTDHAGRGFGETILPHLALSIFRQEPECDRVMFDPDHRNRAARRVCEKAGCVYLGEHDMSNRRMALYALVRTGRPTPVALAQ